MVRDNEGVQKEENTISNIHGKRSFSLYNCFLILEKALNCATSRVQYAPPHDRFDNLVILVFCTE